MAGLTCEKTGGFPVFGKPGTGTAYDHLSIIVPEILDLLEGRLSVREGEKAACFDLLRPFYHGSISDLPDYADRRNPKINAFSGSVFFEKPFYLEGCDTHIFRAEKYGNHQDCAAHCKRELEKFVDRERKRLSSGNLVPKGCKLCCCLVVLNGRDYSTVAVASIAKSEIQ